MNEILEDFAKNYRSLTTEEILSNNNVEIIFKISQLDILLSRIKPSGVYIRLKSNTFEIFGKEVINEVQYQFEDVNLNGKLLIFMAHADFDAISINLDNQKIYFAMQGEDFKVLCNDLVTLFKYFDFLSKKILENNNIDIIASSKKYLEDNDFENVEDFIYFFFK